MNRFGRKLVKAVLLSGTIVTGFALHSTNAKAAEIDEVDAPASTPEEEVQAPEEVAQAVEQVPEEVVVSEEGVQLMAEAPETDSTIQAMEDAVGVIEGDAVAEEGYLNQAEDAIADESLTEETAEDIQAGGQAVLDQAAEKKEQVESAYEEIAEETEAPKTNFNQAAEEGGMKEYVDAIENESDIEKKIELINEAVQKKMEEKEKLEAEIGPDSEAFQKVKSEYDTAKNLYDECVWEIGFWFNLHDYFSIKLAKAEEDYADWENDAEYYENLLNRFYEEAQAHEELEKLMGDRINAWSYYDVSLGSKEYYEEESANLEAEINALYSALREALSSENQKLVDELTKQIGEMNDEYNSMQECIKEAEKDISKYWELGVEADRRYNEILSLYPEAEEFDYAGEERMVSAAYGAYLNRGANVSRELDAQKLNLSRTDARIEKNRTVGMEQEQIVEATGAILDEYSGRCTRLHNAAWTLKWAADDYIAVLTKQSQAKALVDAAIAGYNRVEAAYTQLTASISNYMKASETDGLIKNMEDLVAELEQDVETMKGNQDEANKGMADESLSVPEAYDIYGELEDTFGHASATHTKIEDAYSEISADKEKAEEDFYNIDGVNINKEEVNQISDLARKINKINELIKAAEENLKNQLADSDENSSKYKDLLNEIEGLKRDIQQTEAEIETESFKESIEELKNLYARYEQVHKEYEKCASLREQYRNEINSIDISYTSRLHPLYERYEAELAKLESMPDGEEKKNQQKLVDELYAEYYNLYHEYIAACDAYNDELMLLDEQYESLQIEDTELYCDICELEMYIGSAESNLSQMKSYLNDCEDRKNNLEQKAAKLRVTINDLKEKGDMYKKALKRANYAEELMARANGAIYTISDLYEATGPALMNYIDAHTLKPKEEPNFPVGTQTFEGTFNEPIEFSTVTKVNGEDKKLDVKINPDITGTISMKVEAVKTSSHSPFRPLVTIVADVVGDILVTINNVEFPLPRILNFAISFII